MFTEGTAAHSRYRADPILHLCVRRGIRLVTWCGGGYAYEENTVSQRRCRKCLALAREDVESAAPDEETDLDWYLGRTVTHA